MNAKFVLFCVSLYVCGSLGHRLSFKHVNEFVNDDAEGEHWAFLVASSDGWGNYRHQADVCHAYQILRKHGMPADRIVVMMVDDIAFNPKNPTPGIIINDINGPDVYEGVRIDYRGEDVTPENFLAVLSGKEAAMAGVGTGRVIKSNPNNHVFVNFVDHGGEDILGFPHLTYLEKGDLLDTIQEMHDTNKFGKMIMYIEACEAGTIFQDLPSNINVYAVTAADKDNSWAYCMDAQRDTCLGDLFSVNWMKDSENLNFGDETFHTQFTIVKNATDSSHVSQWGDLTMADTSLNQFLGRVGAPIDHSFDRPPVSQGRECEDLDVAQGDVELAILEFKLRMAETEEKENEIIREIKEYKQEKREVLSIITDIEKKAFMKSLEADENDVTVDASKCYYSAYYLMKEKCFDPKKHMKAKKLLGDLCKSNIPTGIIELSIMEACN